MRISVAIFSLALGVFSATAVAAPLCSSVSGNLVSNCGFESGDFTGWSGTTTTDANSGVDGLHPYEGSFGAFLGTSDTTSTLSQAITTVIGQQYNISFALRDEDSPSVGYLQSFLASFGSNSLLSLTSPVAGPYAVYNYTATASQTSTLLSFTHRNDASYFDLDAISVTPTATTVTPEPSSLVLLGTGLVGVLGAGRRRMQA